MSTYGQAGRGRSCRITRVFGLSSSVFTNFVRFSLAPNEKIAEMFKEAGLEFDSDQPPAEVTDALANAALELMDLFCNEGMHFDTGQIGFDLVVNHGRMVRFTASPRVHRKILSIEKIQVIMPQVAFI